MEIVQIRTKYQLTQHVCLTTHASSCDIEGVSHSDDFAIVVIDSMDKLQWTCRQQMISVVN